MQVGSVLARNELTDAVQHRLELLFGLHAAAPVLLVGILLHAGQHRADAHLHKFVQIALVDRGKAELFEQRNVRILRFLKDTLIE